MNKRQMRREALRLMAGWISGNLSAGYVGSYGGHNGLTDEQIAFMEEVIQNEVGKLDKRTREPEPPDHEPGFPLYLEYENLY